MPEKVATPSLPEGDRQAGGGNPIVANCCPMPATRRSVHSPLSALGASGILARPLGVAGSRWAPRSSKPAAGRSAGRGGFDSHPPPPEAKG